MTFAERYFKRYGCLYGDAYKYEFGEWHHSIKKFESYDEAIEWLYAENYDFREKEFITKTEAISYGYRETD